MAGRQDAEPDRYKTSTINGTPNLASATSSDEMPAYIRHKVGDECEKVGLTSHELTNGWTSDQQGIEITKLMVAEIEQYRQTNHKSHKEARQWFVRLLGMEALKDVSQQSFELSLKRLHQKALEAKRNRHKKMCKVTLLRLRTEKYKLPVSKPTMPQPSTSYNSRQLATRLESTVKHNGRLRKQLNVNKIKVKQAESRETESLKWEQAAVKEAESLKRKRAKDDTRQKRQKRRLHNKALKVKQKELEVKPKSWKQKMNRRNETISTLRKENAALQSTCIKLQKQVKQLTKQKESQRVRALYWEKKAQIQKELKELKKNDKTKNKEMSLLQAQVENMILQVEEKEHYIMLRDGPYSNSPFTAEVRACYMDLLSLEVSAHNVSKVVHSVLTILGQFSLNVTDLPGQTFSQLIRQEANLVATIQAAEHLEHAEVATLHSDGTTKEGVKVVAFQANTSKGRTDTMGCPQVQSGEAADQLSAFKFILDKMACLTTIPANTNQKSKELLAKFKNTMADGAAAQKLFNRLVESYREEVLPDVIQNWNELDGVTKEKIITMNHMYCNLHALIGFATYADEALNNLEVRVWRKWMVSPLGVEGLKEFQDKDGNYNWPHSDSATQRLIRTVCDAFAPGGNQKAGRMQDFKDYLSLKGVKRDTRLKAFRSNRFNILFECAAGVYFHIEHLRDMFEQGYVKAGNKLLRAVLADLKSDPLCASCRALGIVYVQITEPYWRLVEQRDVHILNLTKSLQEAMSLFQQWATDPTPLLNPDLSPVFSTSKGPVKPINDELYNSLYQETTNDITQLTKQALEVIMANISVVVQRRFKDQVPLASSNDPTLRQETADMEKSNRRGENDFGYWSYLQTSKPSLGSMAAEGQLMFKSNSTATWLRALATDDPVKYKAIVMLARKERAAWRKKYEDRQRHQQEIRQAKLNARAQEYAANLRKKEGQLETQRKLLQKYGGPVSCEISCREFIEQLSTQPKTTQKDVLRKHIQFLKSKYPVFSKSNSKMFVMSSQGKQHSITQLSANLCAIVSSPDFIHNTKASPTEQSTIYTQPQTFSDEDAADQISQIKARFAAKVTKPVQDSKTGGDAEKRSDEESREKQEESNGDGKDSEEEENYSDGEESKKEESDGEEREEEDRGGLPIVVGSMIVVAYEDDWAVGEVTEVRNSELSVSFMNRTRKTKGVHIFYWPERPSVYTVGRKFVLQILTRDQLQLSEGSNDKEALTEIQGWKDIERAYTVYYNKYFARRQPRATKPRSRTVL